jgi:Bacteriophage T4-like portal protein (Gp20)
MSWISVATPEYLRQKPKNRRLLLNTPVSGATATYNNINMVSQVYRGRQDRLQRYVLYDWMDNDSDTARALDVLAEHCCLKDHDTHLNLKIRFKHRDVNKEETYILEDILQSWYDLQDFDIRLMRNVRSVLKYGDWFYYRDPETYELYDVHPSMMHAAIVDEQKFEILGWVIKGFKVNLPNHELINNTAGAFEQLRTVLGQSPTSANAKIVPAEDIIHLTLSDGKFSGIGSDDQASNAYASRWPFGDSILENMYKTFKQRELLEDAILIHRMQRAPTRRVWYINVGTTRGDRARWVLQDFRNEYVQRMIPQHFGATGQPLQRAADSTYNPQSMLEDIYLPMYANGESSKVDTLDGQSWSEIPELKYFTSKMLRALRVPYSFLLGPEEGGSVFSDAKVGTAYMQEIEFSRYCKRMQNHLFKSYDKEFKKYCVDRGIPINMGSFVLQFTEPTNYEEFLNNMRAQDNIMTWMNIKDDPYIDAMFALEKYMGWTARDFARNEELFIRNNFPMSQTPMGGDAGGLGGGVIGGPMGGLPPPGEGQDQGQAGPDTAGGIGTGMGTGVGATPSGGGPAAPQMSGYRYELGDDQVNLFEAPITLDDIKPPEQKEDGAGIYSKPAQDDKFFMADSSLHPGPLITLSMVRRLRVAHEKKRLDDEKTLRMQKTIYRKQMPPAGGAGGAAPPPG